MIVPVGLSTARNDPAYLFNFEKHLPTDQPQISITGKNHGRASDFD